MHLLSQLQGHPLKRHLDDYLQRHFISVIITFILILLFVGYNVDPNRGLVNAFISRVVPSSNKIRDGQLWGLMTNCLLEPNLLFLIFSLGWLWLLGRFIERRVSSLFYLWLIISSGIFATMMEMVFTGRPCNGFSAITYSMFGFIWVRSLSLPFIWRIKPYIEIQLILWVVICAGVNYSGLYKITLAGFFFGFIWGALLAFFETIRNKIWRIAIQLSLLGLCSISIFWAPWSVPWLIYKAEKYHELKDYTREKSFYLRALEIDPDDVLAKVGLELITFDMNEEADKLYSEGKVNEARDKYLEILKSFPDDLLAKLNLELIPFKMNEEAKKLYSEGKVSEARNKYSEILRIFLDDTMAKEGLQLIQIEEMHGEVNKLYSEGKVGKAQKMCLEILKIDSDDERAKKCTGSLPDK